MKKTLKSEALNLPTPRKMSFLWNFGSILGVMMGVQMLTGIILACVFFANSADSYSVIDSMVRDLNFGFLFRFSHAKGASMLFLFLYLHVGRGMYFEAYKTNRSTWYVGLAILVLMMGTAFLGYVLPWGKMSYWAATVISNLFSVVPLIGLDLVEWLLGGFSVKTPTLTRFFYAHVLLPFVVLFLVFVHMLSLHKNGSSNPLGVSNGSYLLFHPFFVFKDVLGFVLVFVLFFFVIFFFPYSIMDSDNFREANPLVTPHHMQPEWYFLPAYAMLRSVPNKLGGVVGLLFFLLVLFLSPVLGSALKKNLLKYMASCRVYFFWVWIFSVLGLLWVGTCGVEGWYLMLGQIFSLIYFVFALILLV